MKNLILTLALTLPLAACSMATDKSIITNSTQALAPSLASQVAPNNAVAYLPSIAGPIISVRQKSGNNRVHQTVLYPNLGYGGGENQIIVDVSHVGGNREYYQAPTRRKVLSELKRFFPTMKMVIDETPGENLHGVYGYAYGSSKTDGNCIFAWQVIKNVTRGDLGDVQRFLQTKFASKVRVRYCHPTKTKQQLLVLMNGFRVKEVTSSTIEMLRFSEGAGYVNQSVTTQPSIVKKAPVRVSKAPKRRSRIIRKEKLAAATVPNGPRVLLPTEVGGKQATDLIKKKKPIVTEVSFVDPKAPKVPLPN